MEKREGRKDKLGSYKCKKGQEGKEGAAGRGREGLYERGHWPGGGATWEIPSYSTQTERCRLPLAPTVIIISLTPAATRSLAWHTSLPYKLCLYTRNIPHNSSAYASGREHQLNEHNDCGRKTLKYVNSERTPSRLSRPPPASLSLARYYVLSGSCAASNFSARVCLS